MNMKTLLCCMALLGASAAFSQKNEWLDPNVNAVNRAPMHTHYFAYESADHALRGAVAA